MTHRLTTNYAQNYCNGHLLLVIVENVLTCFLGHSVVLIIQLVKYKRRQTCAGNCSYGIYR